MYRLILIISTVLISQIINAQVYNYEWVKTQESTPAISYDENGNIYIINSFTDTINVEGNILISNGGSDFFIAKYDSNDVLLWIEHMGGSGNDYGMNIYYKADSVLYFSGTFNSTIIFDDTTLTALGSDDIFLTKFTEPDSIIWVQQAGGGTTSGNNTKSMVTDDDNVYLTGSFNDSTLFGDTLLISNDYLGMFKNLGFLAKYDQTGSLIWIRIPPGLESEYNSVDIDNSNNIIVTGTFTDIGGSSFTLTKYNDSGNIIFEKTAELPFSPQVIMNFGNSICIDNDNNIYTAISNYSGFEYDSLQLDNGNYVIKFDKSGTIIWYKKAGGFNGYRKCSITENNNRLLFQGNFYGTETFDTTSLTATTGISIVITELDTSGNFLWAKKIDGMESIGHEIVCLDNSTIYLSGSLSQTASFDSISVSFNGIEGFLTKLNLNQTINIFDLDLNPLLYLYPNPANDHIIIQSKNEGLNILEIHSAEGKLVLSEALDSTSNRIDISNLKNGLYFVTLISKKKITTKKLLVY